MNQKRIRSLNWDEEEKQLFRSVLKEYAQVIENKCLDTHTNKIKNKAWEEVHKKFNELNSRHRQLSQLKIQWKTMKVNARKTYSTYNNEKNKTGGGARPTTPSDAVIEIKDLLNPAELLRDDNMYDSDGIIPSSSENKVALATTSETSAITLQDSKPETYMVKALENNNIINLEDQQIDNIYIETIEDVDAQVGVREITPLVISQDYATVDTAMKKKIDRIQAKISQENTIMGTPVNKNIDTILTKKVPKRKIIINKIPENSLKSKKLTGFFFMTSVVFTLMDIHHADIKEGITLIVTGCLLVFVIVFMAFTIVLLIGLHMDKAKLVNAYLVYVLIQLVVTIILFFVHFAGVIDGGIIIRDLFSILLTIYFWLVIKSFYLTMDEAEDDDDTD